jgi:hypothetical protein
MPSTEFLLALRRALLTEQETRWRQKGYNPTISARVQLYERLDKMKANRERLGSPYPEMTQAQKADLESYLVEVSQRQTE